VHSGGEKTPGGGGGEDSDSEENGPNPPSLECTFRLFLPFFPLFNFLFGGTMKEGKGEPNCDRHNRS
jgi:hypothetical protein